MGRAFLTIFQAMTLEGWSDIMYFCQDSVDWVWATSYFVILTVFGGFFALNLVLAVLEGSFNTDADASTGSDDAAAGAAERAPPPATLGRRLLALLPEGGMRAKPIYTTVKSDKVAYFFTTLIVINTIALASEYHGMDSSTATFLESSTSC